MAIMIIAVFWGCTDQETNPVSPPKQTPPVVFDDLEAVHLTYQVHRSLLPKIEYYNRIRNEVAAIRSAYPDMKDVDNRPPWVAGEAMVEFTTQAMDQIRAGEYHGLDSIESELGEIKLDTNLFRFGWGKLTFDEPYHAGVLSEIVITAEGITDASLNHYIGDGNSITVAWPHYIFSFGWGDCPAGCIHRHFWKFYVDEDTVQLVQEYGDDLWW